MSLTHAHWMLRFEHRVMGAMRGTHSISGTQDDRELSSAERSGPHEMEPSGKGAVGGDQAATQSSAALS